MAGRPPGDPFGGACSFRRDLELSGFRGWWGGSSGHSNPTCVGRCSEAGVLGGGT